MDAVRKTESICPESRLSKKPNLTQSTVCALHIHHIVCSTGKYDYRQFKTGEELSIFPICTHCKAKNVLIIFIATANNPVL